MCQEYLAPQPPRDSSGRRWRPGGEPLAAPREAGQTPAELDKPGHSGPVQEEVVAHLARPSARGVELPRRGPGLYR